MNGNNISQASYNMNSKTYIDYYERLKLIATSLFTWEGLDEIGGNSRFLERTLFDYGRAVFVKDEELGYLSIRVNPSDKINIYELPTVVSAWSFGYEKKYPLDEVVYIMNNESQRPTKDTISLFAWRLYEVERTMDVNVKSSKSPIILEGDSKSILTLKNIYEQYDGNQPVIIARKNFNINDKINAIKTDVPLIVNDLMLYKHDIMNEVLTFLGIDNANTDKKERLITDEVNSNNELIKFYLNCFYKTRKRACDEINDKFFNGEEKIKLKVNTEVLDLINASLNDIIDLDNTGEENSNFENVEVEDE